jgi:hypothetical protein
MPCKYIVNLNYKTFSSQKQKDRLVVAPLKDYKKRQLMSEPREDDKILPRMTNIFRMNFWSVFSKIYVYTPDKKNCRIYEQPAEISSVFVVYSEEEKFYRKNLDRSEYSDYIVTVVFSLKCSASELENAISNKIDVDSDLKRERYIRGLIKECYGSESMDVEATVPGCNAHISEDKDLTDDESIALISSFYHYGWVTLKRLEREQIELKVNPSEKKVLNSSSDDIIKQRVRLINIKRRFLSDDRTNNKELKALCLTLQQKYKMNDRFESRKAVLELFEHHLDNTSKIMQVRQTRAVSNVLNILTFSTIPLGLMGTILAIDLSASIFKEPDNVFQVDTLYTILIISFVTPVILIGLAKIVDIIWHSVANSEH